MKYLLVVASLVAVFTLSGCFEAETCAPAYSPTGNLVFEDLSEIPVTLSVDDNRSDRVFFKHVWSRYSEPNYEKEYQPVKLERPSREILADAVRAALGSYGYSVS